MGHVRCNLVLKLYKNVIKQKDKMVICNCTFYFDHDPLLLFPKLFSFVLNHIKYKIRTKLVGRVRLHGGERNRDVYFKLETNAPLLSKKRF